MTAAGIAEAIGRIPWPLWLFVGIVGFLGVVKLTIEGAGWG